MIAEEHGLTSADDSSSLTQGTAAKQLPSEEDNGYPVGITFGKDPGGPNSERQRLDVVRGISDPERSGIAGRSNVVMVDNSDCGCITVLGASASTKGLLW
jgi:hypothetical protein